MLALRALAAAALVVAAIPLVAGCDKLKSMAGGGSEGGAPSSGGGGVLSFLGSDFEGEITMLVSERAKRKDIPQQIVFEIKKPKYRLDFTGMESKNPQLAGGGSMILDAPSKKGYLLIHPQKTAMVIDFEKMKAMKSQGGSIPGLGGTKAPSGTPEPPPKIEKTGKKDTVAGYTCDIWNITSSDGKKAELCMAEGITWIDIGDLGWASAEILAAAAISDMNHFPLRVVAYDAKGVEETRMEAQKVDKKKLDDAKFTVPPDYKVMDLSAMMGGMMAPGASAFPRGGPPHPPGR